METDFYKEIMYTEISGKELNDIYGLKPIFYKCLANNLTHHDFTYKLGLNVDTIEFCPSGRYKAGGLYLTDYDNIAMFLNYGPKIATITVPDDARCYLECNKFKCDKIIIESIMCLKDHEFGNNTEFCVNAVKHNGCVLQLIKEQTFELCMVAVKNNGLSLRFVNETIQQHDKYQEICITVCKFYNKRIV